MSTVALSTGVKVALREPNAGDLRGIKLLDVLQLDAGACAPLIERLSAGALPAVEFWGLSGADAMALMTAVVGFFAPEATEPSASPPASKTPGR